MLAGIVLGVLAKMEIGGLLGIILPVFLFFFNEWDYISSATAAALDDVPEIAGAASALLGSLQYSNGIISSLLLAFFQMILQNQWP